MYHESQYHTQNSFITLTYRDPAPPRLSVDHMQRFLKRLRKHEGCLRYFYAGEYGERTHRPHYHIMIFGRDFLEGATPYGDNRHLHEGLEKIWGYGTIDLARCETASCMYIGGYAAKKLGDKDTFCRQSRRPPIGYNWAKANLDNMIRLQRVTVDGVQNPIPTVYFKWFPHELQSIKDKSELYIHGLTPEQVWNKRVGARSKELNIKSKQTERNHVL